VLLLGDTQTDRKKFRVGQKTPYYNRPTQDGLRGHFVLRAIGKRFGKDRTAGCEKVVGIRFALDSSLERAGFEPSVMLLAPDRCNITAVPADSKTVISAGTCRPRRRAREKVSAAPRLLLRAPDPRETLKFAGDSPLEGDGFEPSVPRQIRSRFESRSASHDRRFEAASPCGSLWGEVYKAS
jgi:hypothetical protein